MTAGGPDGRVDLGILLRDLARRGILSLLVEGGGTVHGAFVDAGLVDKVLIFVAPKIFGGPAPGPVAGTGVVHPVQAWRITRPEIRRVGEDFLIEGYLEGTSCSRAS